MREADAVELKVLLLSLGTPNKHASSSTGQLPGTCAIGLALQDTAQKESDVFVVNLNNVSAGTQPVP